MRFFRSRFFRDVPVLEPTIEPLPNLQLLLKLQYNMQIGKRHPCGK